MPIQTLACDRCTQGVMDATNDHIRGLCKCDCHGKMLHGSIELVDFRDRTIARLPLDAKGIKGATTAMYSALERWRNLEAVGAYVRDEDGRILTYC